MGKTTKNTNARVAAQRNETRERAAEQLCMDNISTVLNEFSMSLTISDIPVIAVKFPNFYRTVFSLT